MKKILAVFCLCLFLWFPGSVSGVDVSYTKLICQPAVGAGRIVFVYANDLWVVGIDGGTAWRLTSTPGVESNPAISPDGKWVAFSGQYNGNTDVFILPIEGGVPRRLTWHPSEDIVQGFTPDGKFVLFTSPRDSPYRHYNTFHGRFFTVSVDGGFPDPLKVPVAFKGVISPDNRYIAYNPYPEAFTQWKNYRGGKFSRIWIFDQTDNSIRKVPQPEGRSNDPGPMWDGKTIYFRSDRNGEFNLFSYDPASNEVRQITFHEDYPVLDASISGGLIVYEQAGSLHLYDIAAGKSRQLRIGVPSDLTEVRERYVKGGKWIRNASISPSGARAAFEFRGEIVTVPAEKGDARYITDTPGAHERSPVWSPDGKSIAYFSDESGEYALHVRDQEGRGDARVYPLSGSGFYESPVWAPDGKKIGFFDNSLTLSWIDLGTGIVKKIGAERLLSLYRPKSVRPAWSPDSRWIAYTLWSETYIQKAYVYSLERDKSYPITDGLSDVSEPVFDASGQYLYFLDSTDSGPVRQWFDQSNLDMRMTNSLYVAVLRKDIPSPLAKESDEEKSKAPVPELKDAGKTSGGDAAKLSNAVAIDFDGLDRRILALPVPAGYYWNLQAGEPGKIYYEEEYKPMTGEPLGTEPGPASIHVFDLEKRTEETILPNALTFQISADRKKILFSSDGTWFIVPSSRKSQPGEGRLDTDSIEIKIDPRAEWMQIFNEAWRINRDYFYDPNMHGADWAEMKKKYAGFLPHLSCRSDLNRIIQWMLSELAVGHSKVRRGDTPYQEKTVPVGLLGADYEIADGLYRFKKIFGGLNWTPDLKCPLAEPGVNVREGEYLLAVDGKDVRPPANLYSFFENTVGKIVEIKVGPSPDGKGARTVKVVPIAEEGSLRGLDWVEGNIRKVHEATNGRVAYVFVPDTAREGHAYFKKYFYPQADKEAIIVDERFNGGGWIADYYIDHLREPVSAFWAHRYGADLKTPSASIQGPKVMLINETSGSGGDTLPFLWRKFGLGKLVGTPTWGGLVGTYEFPVLMDGGVVTAPNFGIWTEDGFVVENVGVPPDIEVEQTPAELIAGHDPQLEKAVQIVMEELKINQPHKPKRPPFPIRVRKNATSEARPS